MLVGLSIEIGNGQTAQLKVFEGDNVADRAIEFCWENNLDLKIAPVLET